MQSFGTTRDVLVRVLPEEGKDINQVSEGVLAAIRSYAPGVELRRTDAVGAQVGRELAEKGALAAIFTFLMILDLRRLALPVEARRWARSSRRCTIQSWCWASSPRRR